MNSLKKAMTNLKESKKLEAIRELNESKLSEAIKSVKIIKENCCNCNEEPVEEPKELTDEFPVEELVDTVPAEESEELVDELPVDGLVEENKDLKEEVEIEVNEEDIITDPENVEVVEEPKEETEEKGRLIEFEIKNEAYYRDFGDGYKRAVLTSTDSGTVTVVEVKDEDGDFYIVGINHPEREFEDIEVERYLSKEKAEEAGAEAVELIDKYTDLDELGGSFDFNTNNIYEKIARKVREKVKTDMPIPEAKEVKECKITDLNEKSFNKLFSQFVRENFKNAKNIRVQKVTENKEGLKLESVINYKSGKSCPVVFEVKGEIKEGASTVKIFESKIFKNENVERPIMTAKLNTQNGMIKLEKLKYDFNTTLKEGKIANVYGVIKG